MNVPKVSIGCVVRNRAWILPRYLAALEAVEWPKKEYIFLENDSEDETFMILAEFADHHPCRLYSIRTGAEKWDRGDYAQDLYANLAHVRNAFAERFLRSDADYLLSVDSDVLVPPDILLRLMEHADERTIIGAAISNIPGRPLDGTTPGNFMVFHHSGFMVHPARYKLSGIMDVAVIGAVYLIPRRALEDGIRYAPDIQGEDIPFCREAKAKGYRIRVMLDLVCEHKMTRD